MLVFTCRSAFTGYVTECFSVVRSEERWRKREEIVDACGKYVKTVDFGMAGNIYIPEPVMIGDIYISEPVTLLINILNINPF